MRASFRPGISYTFRGIPSKSKVVGFDTVRVHD